MGPKSGAAGPKPGREKGGNCGEEWITNKKRIKGRPPALRPQLSETKSKALTSS